MGKAQNTTIVAAGFLGLAAIVLLSNKKTEAPKTVSNFTGSPTDFIIKMYPAALAVKKLFPNVPAEIILAFSGLESSWGKHAPQFNFFGVKTGKAWTGAKQLLKTSEILPKNTGYNFPEVINIERYAKDPTKFRWVVRDYFRAYPSAAAGFADFAKFISSGRYKKAYESKDPKQIARAIWAAGYATDPNYPAKIARLLDIINEVIKKYGV